MEYVKKFLEEKQVFYSQQREDFLVVSIAEKARVEDEFRQIIKAVNNDTTFLIYSVFPFKVPQPQLKRMAQLLTEINWTLKIGAFELDLNDGEIRFKTCFKRSILIPEESEANILSEEEKEEGDSSEDDESLLTNNLMIMLTLIKQEVFALVEKSYFTNLATFSKFYLAIKKEALGTNVHVHNKVSCSVCRIYPIVGKRYKCLSNPDFNLCEQCFSNEARDGHGIDGPLESYLDSDFQKIADPLDSSVEIERLKKSKDSHANSKPSSTQLLLPTNDPGVNFSHVNASNYTFQVPPYHQNKQSILSDSLKMFMLSDPLENDLFRFPAFVTKLEGGALVHFNWTDSLEKLTGLSLGDRFYHPEEGYATFVGSDFGAIRQQVRSAEDPEERGIQMYAVFDDEMFPRPIEFGASEVRFIRKRSSIVVQIPAKTNCDDREILSVQIGTSECKRYGFLAGDVVESSSSGLRGTVLGLSVEENPRLLVRWLDRGDERIEKILDSNPSKTLCLVCRYGMAAARPFPAENYGNTVPREGNLVIGTIEATFLAFFPGDLVYFPEEDSIDSSERKLGIVIGIGSASKNCYVRERDSSRIVRIESGQNLRQIGFSIACRFAGSSRSKVIAQDTDVIVSVSLSSDEYSRIGFYPGDPVQDGSGKKYRVVGTGADKKIYIRPRGSAKAIGIKVVDSCFQLPKMGFTLVSEAQFNVNEQIEDGNSGEEDEVAENEQDEIDTYFLDLLLKSGSTKQSEASKEESSDLLGPLDLLDVDIQDCTQVLIEGKNGGLGAGRTMPALLYDSCPVWINVIENFKATRVVSMNDFLNEAVKIQFVYIELFLAYLCLLTLHKQNFPVRKTCTLSRYHRSSIGPCLTCRKS